MPPLCTFLALAWHDAYRGTAPGSPPRASWGEAAAVMVGIGVAQPLTAATAALTSLPAAWLLTGPQLLFAVSALPVLCRRLVATGIEFISATQNFGTGKGANFTRGLLGVVDERTC